MKKRLYYKVLNNGKKAPVMSSACQNSGMSSAIRVTYKVGKYVKPNLADSKLFVFESEEEAIRFIRHDLLSDTSVWSCYAKNPVKATGYRGILSLIVAFWAGDKDAQLGSEFPVGTIWADEVKVLEKVWDYNE
jgi:hypothetical protein